MIKIKHKNKQEYDFFKNTLFVIGKLWNWDKSILFYIFCRIPILIILPLCTVYLPKIIISEVENSNTVMHMLESMWFVSTLILLMSMGEKFIVAKSNLHAIKVSHDLSQLISTKAMNTYYEYIDKPSTQILIKKAYEMVFYRRESHGIHMLPQIQAALISNIVGVIIYSGILGALSPLIIVLIIVTSLISYFTNIAINKWVFRNRDHWFQLDLKMAYLTYKSGSFDTAKDIRIYNMKQWFYDAFYALINQRIKWTLKMQFMYFIGGALNAFFVLIRDGVGYFYLIYLIFNGKISVSDFVLYFGIISGFSNWCMSIIDNCSKLNEINYNICDLRTYLDLPEYTAEVPHYATSTVSPVDYSINLKNISYCYGSNEPPALKNINLYIKSGEKIAIVGANGAGKTTFVKLICGLYRPSSGEIEIGGHNLEDYRKDVLYELFAPVFQDVRLLPVSIEKNITLCESKLINREYLNTCLALSGLNEVIAKLPDGLDTLLVRDMDEKAVQLSGGEQQKLMLARALYKNAPIMILDEPTAALDPVAENHMYLKYNELTQGKTSIFISHRLASTRFCDRIILIDQGEIIEVGTHEELLAAGKNYAEMFEIQAQYYKSTMEGYENDNSYEEL